MMTEDQRNILETLYENNKEFREMTDKILKEEADKALKIASKLQSASALFNVTTNIGTKSKRSPPPESCTRNHREVILKTLKANQGVSVGDLRRILKSEHNHTIGVRTLNTLVGEYRKRGLLKSEGEKGNFKWYVRSI
jgi:predicted HTH transcriptional regulator